MAVFKFRNLNNGQATPIPEGEFSVGRADDAYIHLDDASVSRRHAMIFNSSEGLFLEDLGSANGTAAHGSYLTGRIQIAENDVIHIGSVPFRVDPEVAGEPTVAPSAGLRTSNRAYMRRDTERLPSQTEPSLARATVSLANLKAPPLNATSTGALSLSEIATREPVAAKPAQIEMVAPAIRATGGNFIAPAKPANTPQRQVVPLRRASQRITIQPVHTTPPEPVTMLPKSEPVVVAKSEPVPPATTFTPPTIHPPAPVAIPTTPVVATPEPAPAPTQIVRVETVPDETHWGWWLLMYLAGVGTGLVLALYFVKVFIEFGGKVSSLP